jgi:hypothetical protein
MDLLLIFGIPLAVGFAAGYSFRAYISRRRRKLAQLHSPWPVPPAGRR